MAVFSYIILALALLPYLVVPILIWATQRFLPSIHLRCVEERFLPKEVLQRFEAFTKSLEAKDFAFCFDALIPDEFMGLRFYHRVMVSPLHKSWGLCTVICTEDGVVRNSYDEFRTLMPNGITLSTHNSDLLGAPLNSQKRKIFAMPSTTKCETLFDIHWMKLKKQKEFESVLAPDESEALENFKALLNQDHEEQIELGAIYLDPEEKVYRPSWAGAFLIGWYSMWPSTFIRRWFAAIRIRFLMKELNA